MVVVAVAVVAAVGPKTLTIATYKKVGGTRPFRRWRRGKNRYVSSCMLKTIEVMLSLPQ